MKTYVIAECIGCGAKKKVLRNEIPKDEMPICDKCRMPMIANMTAKQAAKITELSVSTIYTLAQQDRIPHTRCPRLTFSYRGLLYWMEGSDTYQILMERKK